MADGGRHVSHDLRQRHGDLVWRVRFKDDRFCRIWRECPDGLRVEHEYFHRGPHPCDRSENVPGASPGSLPGYEFNWTVADYVSAVLEAGCELAAIDEFGDERQRWEYAPMDGLPYYLVLLGRKR